MSIHPASQTHWLRSGASRGF